MKTIKESEWFVIQRKLSKLEHLEAGGVDNWEWYGESLKEWFKDQAIIDAASEFIDNLNDILAEADVDEPAGRGCGHAISYDEDAVRNRLIEFYEAIKSEE